LVINSNISAARSVRLLADSASTLSKSLSRLASGSRIVSPEDDAAGLAQTIKFDAQLHRNEAASTNLANAVSFSQTQDGYLQKVQKAVDRMGEIAVLAQDATKTDGDRANYDSEYQKLYDFVYDIGTKQFNGVDLFGTSGLTVTTDSDASAFTMEAIDYDGDIALALDLLDVTSTTNALTALNTIKDVVQSIASDRAKIGANIARLTNTMDSLSVHSENLQQANSRIKDADVAQESTQFARANILVQSGTAMLAQGNTLPQAALRLLG
jgi:flagellin